MSFCSDLFDSLLPFAIIGLVGLILNAMSVLCFTHLVLESRKLVKRHTQQSAGASSPIRNMVSFLFLKSVLDTIGSCINLLCFVVIGSSPRSLRYNIYLVYLINFLLYLLGKLILKQLNLYLTSF